MNFETVLSVTHYSDYLFSFQTTKNEDFKQFKAGQFTMLGMGDDDLIRAYSIASAPHQPYLEFLSIKVPEGALTSRLQHIKKGDTIEVLNRPTGTLVINNLTPAKRLWCISTGTGLAPFLSVARDPETAQKFDQIIVTHTVRTREELAYADVLQSLPITYYPTVTREAFHTQGRITDLITNKKVFADLNIPEWTPAEDSVLMCGSQTFNDDLKNILVDAGFSHGSNRQAGDFVQERAYVTQRGLETA